MTNDKKYNHVTKVQNYKTGEIRFVRTYGTSADHLHNVNCEHKRGYFIVVS